MILGNKVRFGLFVSLLLTAALLAGCWNRKEVNQIFFISAAGVEKKDNSVRLTIQFFRPQKREQNAQQSSGQASALVVTTQGETLFEALRMMNTRLPRKGLWSHAFAVVLSEEIAERGFLSYIDFLRRDHEVREDLVLLIAEKPEPLLRSEPNIETVLARELKDTVRGGMNFEGVSVLSTLHEVSKAQYSASPYAVITHATLNKNTGKFRLDGLSFFRKDRLVGTFKGKDVTGWQWITGQIRSTIVPLPCESREGSPRGMLSVEIIEASSKLEVHGNNDNLTLKVKVKAKSNVGENGCLIDLKQEEEFLKIGKLASDEVRKIIVNMLDYAQKTIKTDVFGFGSAYYRKNPSGWKKVKDDWNELFAKAKRDIKVDIEVVGSGLIYSDKVGE